MNVAEISDPQGRPIRHGPYPELTWTGGFAAFDVYGVGQVEPREHSHAHRTPDRQR